MFGCKPLIANGNSRARTSRGLRVRLGFARSEYQRPVEIQGRFGANMLDTAPGVGAQVVEAVAVGLRVVLVDQPRAVQRTL